MSDNTSVTRKDNTSPRTEAALIPPVDVIESPSGITLYADLPGVPKDKLTLQLEADSLTIAGEVAFPMPDSMESSYAEVTLPRYQRVFGLSRDLAHEKASAEFRNGVLTLRIPKAEHAQPRRIEVRAS